MDTQNNGVTAKDFFLHLGAMITLYWFLGALLSLAHSIINVAFPVIDSYYGYNRSISFPVASLIVIFPAFLALSWLNVRSYIENPMKREIWVRRWIYFFTLFVSGAILLGSLVSVMYLFLDGRELTTGFVLKVLAWVIVSGGVFGYYIQELKGLSNLRTQKIWMAGVVLVVIALIALGFSVIGSPRTQRLVRYDNQKITDLQNIQSQVLSYWQAKRALPQDLTSLNDPLSSYYQMIPQDPQTDEEYSYRVVSPLSFELCANFNLDSEKVSSSLSRPEYSNGLIDENWNHDAGTQCFTREIDPDRYPPFKN